MIDEAKVLDRYALARCLIPDINAAGDLFVETHSEEELRRRAAVWRRRRGLPELVASQAPVALSEEERAYALRLAAHAMRRNRIQRVAMGVALSLFVAMLPIAFRQWDPTPWFGGSGSAFRPLELAVGFQRGRQTLVGASCRQSSARLIPAGPPEEYRLVLQVSYAPDGPEPRVARATLERLPDQERPGKITLDVRADYARPDSHGCYGLNTQITLPAFMQGRVLAFDVTVRSEAKATGISWTTNSMLVP